MFIKSFKTKSNTQIKSTERKKLRNKIATAFKISEDDLNKLLPNKGALTQVKIITNNEQPVTVYSCDKRPLFFELAGNDDSPLSASSVLLPTVYALWILPNLIPIFTTHQQVFPRLLSGADLMLPGKPNILVYTIKIFYLMNWTDFYQVLLGKVKDTRRMVHITKML